MKVNKTPNGKRLIGLLFFAEKAFVIIYMHGSMQQIWQISFLQTVVNSLDMKSTKPRIRNIKLVDVENY